MWYVAGGLEGLELTVVHYLASAFGGSLNDVDKRSANRGAWSLTFKEHHAIHHPPSIIPTYFPQHRKSGRNWNSHSLLPVLVSVPVSRTWWQLN